MFDLRGKHVFPCFKFSKSHGRVRVRVLRPARSRTPFEFRHSIGLPLALMLNRRLRLRAFYVSLFLARWEGFGMNLSEVAGLSRFFCQKRAHVMPKELSTMVIFGGQIQSTVHYYHCHGRACPEACRHCLIRLLARCRYGIH